MNNVYSSFRQVESTMSNNSEVVIEKENVRIRTVHTYQNSGGDLASEVKTTMDLSGKILSESENVYGPNGRVTSNSNRVYGANGVITSRIDKKYSYDKSGYLVQENSATGTFDGKGKLNELVKIKQKFDTFGLEISHSRDVYDASGKRTSNFSYSSPAQFKVKSDQLVSAMNGFGTLNRAPVVATIGQPNRAVVRITMSDSHSPSYEPISYSV